MEKKIADYLPHYIGQKVQFIADEIGILKGFCESEVEHDKTIAIIDVGSDRFIEWYAEEVKLILRPLSSMTEEEATELDWNQRIGWESRWDGIGRPQVIYPREFHWLIKKGFDIFGLIESGLAIEKTT
jgi:hypothetical protein